MSHFFNTEANLLSPGLWSLSTLELTQRNLVLSISAPWHLPFGGSKLKKEALRNYTLRVQALFSFVPSSPSPSLSLDGQTDLYNSTTERVFFSSFRNQHPWQDALSACICSPVKRLSLFSQFPSVKHQLW